MKRILTLALAALIVFTLAACGDAQSAATPELAATPAATPNVTEEIAATEAPETAGASSILIAYFSWSGNTEALAGWNTVRNRRHISLR